MALFTDQTVSSVDDLLRYEANLRETVAPEGIELEGKLELAQDEVGARLDLLVSRSGFLVSAANSAGLGLAAPGASRLNHVVVTPPLRLWHAFQSLGLVFRDLVGRKANTALEAKWMEYRRLAKWAEDLLCQSGIGLVGNPIPKAVSPTLDTIAGSSAQIVLYVSATLTNEAGLEGLGSAAEAIRIPDSSLLRATMSAEDPADTIGYNLYAGSSRDRLTRQNAAPIVAGQPWVMPESGLIEGSLLGSGQSADFHKIVPRSLDRG